MPICCLSTTSHGIICLIVTKIKLSIILMERFTLEVSDNYVKKTLGKKWKDHKSALKKEYFKKNISLEEKLQNVSPGTLRYQWEDAVRFWNSKIGETKG
ncbi:hypothetical protein Gotur_031240 [Gossypium turneri]